ncbi:hypothetical protein DPMN_153404 [Dreissena polymorpha]|uniref:Secreted protein n=1 Tax=Dreissena polymorpha TaxID=45954 RepID=A0A9D4J8W2_DREPO|nr:hypothetical protein DPMN_153404 [Dreissena polymorpha]
MRMRLVSIPPIVTFVIVTGAMRGMESCAAKRATTSARTGSASMTWGITTAIATWAGLGKTATTTANATGIACVRLGLAFATFA